MTSALDVGLVRPRHLWVPDYDFTFGPEVASVNRQAGYGPDPEQELVLNALFAENADGTPTFPEVATIAPRRNLKTGLQLQAIIGWAFVLDVPEIAYTVHRWKSGQATFLALQSIVRGAPFLAKRVETFMTGNGEQKMVLTNGHRVLFMTRSPDQGRALDIDKLILDEDLETKDEQLGALVPAMGTRPLAQILRGSSAGKANSTVLRRVRDRGRRGAADPAAGDPTLAYFEWCAPDPGEACDRGDDCDHELTTAGCGCDKPELLAEANSQYGKRLAPSRVRNERGTMSPAQFGRERMGWWDKPGLGESDTPALDAEAWDELVDDEPDGAPETWTAYGIETDLDRAFSSIGTAANRDDGRQHVEMVKRSRGTRWLVDACRRLDEAHGPAVFAVDGGGPLQDLIPELEQEGLLVLTAGTSDVAAAAAAVVDGVNEQTLVHSSDPLLDEAVAGARRRYFRDGGFTFGRRASAADVTPLVAVTLALWALNSDAGGPNVW